MALNYPKLQLPDAPETIAFRLVERILTTDPTLKRVVRKWVAWQGETADLLDPTNATCPYIRLSPQPASSAWETEGQHKMPVVIRIQAAVAGANVDQLMNLWHAVRTALWPTNDLVRQTAIKQWTAEAGINRPILTQSAYGAKVESKGLYMLLAEGSLTLSMFINTP